MLASGSTYKGCPGFDLKSSPAERCSLFSSFPLLPLLGNQLPGEFPLHRVSSFRLELTRHWEEPSSWVSFTIQRSYPRVSRLENDTLLKEPLASLTFNFLLRIPLNRQLPSNRQTSAGSGSGGCDFDPWTQVSISLRNSASSFHWLSSSIFTVCSLFVVPHR